MRSTRIATSHRRGCGTPFQRDRVLPHRLSQIGNTARVIIIIIVDIGKKGNQLVFLELRIHRSVIINTTRGIGEIVTPHSGSMPAGIQGDVPAASSRLAAATTRSDPSKSIHSNVPIGQRLPPCIAQGRQERPVRSTISCGTP